MISVVSGSRNIFWHLASTNVIHRIDFCAAFDPFPAQIRPDLLLFVLSSINRTTLLKDWAGVLSETAATAACLAEVVRPTKGDVPR